ncbi:MAG: triose-phosphate transporter family-domain-containing protein [Monoraphidium minutum]|nr:MAG: triose-phosphate transporter family-domain-containing protein [Monoraphidium minutum]
MLRAPLVICSSLQPPACWAEPQAPPQQQQQHSIVDGLRRLMQGGGPAAEPPPPAAPAPAAPLPPAPTAKEAAAAAAAARKREAAAVALRDVLGVGQREAELVVGADADLAALSKRQMQDHLNRLGKLTRLTPDQAKAAATRLPRLLALEPKARPRPAPPREARRRLDQLGELLGVDDARGAALVGRQPGLLLHAPETLKLRLRAVGALLQLAPPAVREAAAREPGLIAFRPSELRGRLDFLTERLRLPPARAAALAARTPALLTQLPRPLVEQRLAALAAALGLPSPDAAAAAAGRAPAVLLEPPSLVDAQIANLGRILGVTPPEAAALAAAQPSLLLLPPQVMRSRLESLAAALKADVEDARTAVVKRPALLSAPPSVLRKAAEEAGHCSGEARRESVVAASAAGGAAAASPGGSSVSALKVPFYILLWYAFNIIFNILNKSALNVFPCPWLISTMQLAASGLFMVFLWVTKLQPAPKIDKAFMIAMLPVGLFHTIGHVSACVAVSFAHIVKSAEPVFSVILSGPLLGLTYPWYVWGSLLPIVAGCSLSAMKEVSFSWGGFNYAMVSNLGMVLRNIYSKKSLNDYKHIDGINLFGLISIVSLLYCAPAAVFAEGAMWGAAWDAAVAKAGQGALLQLLALGGLFYHLYNQASYMVLDQGISPVTFSVGNTMKRVAVVVSSVMFFKNPVSFMNWLGSGIAIAGTYLYTLATDKQKAEEAAKKKKA